MFQYTAASLYAQILQELGGVGVSAAQAGAIRNRLQEGVIDITHAHPWSWRRRREDFTVTAASGYVTLPEDFDGFTVSRLFTVDSDDSERSIVAVPDQDFEQFVKTTATGEPKYFRLTQRACGSTNRAVMEVAPPLDASYTFSDIEYFAAAETLNFSAATPVQMPTQFHDVWHERALADAADVLGQETVSRVHMAKYHEKLQSAIPKRDEAFPQGPPPTVHDPYQDWMRLR